MAPYPEGGRGRRISQGGGLAPVWSRDGKQLFFRHSGWVMRVSWDERSDFVPEASRLFPEPFWLGQITHMERNYDVARTGGSS